MSKLQLICVVTMNLGSGKVLEIQIKNQINSIERMKQRKSKPSVDIHKKVLYDMIYQNYIFSQSSLFNLGIACVGAVVPNLLSSN